MLHCAVLQLSMCESIHWKGACDIKVTYELKELSISNWITLYNVKSKSPIEYPDIEDISDRISGFNFRANPPALLSMDHMNKRIYVIEDISFVMQRGSKYVKYWSSWRGDSQRFQCSCSPNTWRIFQLGFPWFLPLLLHLGFSWNLHRYHDFVKNFALPSFFIKLWRKLES